MKKIFSVILIAAGLQIGSAVNAANEPDWFFYFGVKSGAEIKATVWDNFDFQIQLPTAGWIVDPSSATFSAGMKNAVSLGFQPGEVRQHEVTIETGVSSSEVDLTEWLPNTFAFEGATLNGRVILEDGTEKPFTYTISEKGSDGVIYASTTQQQMHDAWYALTSQVTAGQDNPAGDDTYMLVKAGSYLQYGNEQLFFNQDVEFFKGAWTMDDAITEFGSKTELKEMNLTGADMYKAILSVNAGSILAISSSYATNKMDAMIIFDFSEAYDGSDLTGILSELKSYVDTKDVLNFLQSTVGLVDNMVGYIDKAEIVNLEVKLVDPWKVIRGANALIVPNDHVLEIGEIGTFVVPQSVKEVRGGVIYEINERIGAVEAVTAMDLVEAEFPLVASRPYIFKATANQLEVLMEGEVVSEAGEYNGLIGKYEHFDIPAWDGSSIWNFIIYHNLMQLCGENCSINAGLAYVDMNAVPQQGHGNAAPSRKHLVMSKSSTTAFQNNILVPMVGVHKIMQDGHIMVIREGKMYTTLGTQF